jgi:hypothetical protein
MFSYSYSQNPNVDTRFQFATGPQAAIIFLIIASGTLSLMLPANGKNEEEKKLKLTVEIFFTQNPYICTYENGDFWTFIKVNCLI